LARLLQPAGAGVIQDEAAEADAIADLVNRLALLHGDPERFHLVKDEAARRLRRMAGRLRGDSPRRRATTTWRPDGRP
jgi:hypothetical protein